MRIDDPGQYRPASGIDDLGLSRNGDSRCLANRQNTMAADDHHAVGYGGLADTVYDRAIGNDHDFILDDDDFTWRCCIRIQVDNQTGGDAPQPSESTQ